MSQAIGEIIDQVFDNVYNRFKYVPDLKAWGQIEYWASIQDDAVKMTRDGIVTGDCDDFALMCRYQLDAFRIPNHLVFCQVETGEYHLVCEVNGWILDCRHSQVMPRYLLDYKWLSRSGVKPGEPWHSIAG